MLYSLLCYKLQRLSWSSGSESYSILIGGLIFSFCCPGSKRKRGGEFRHFARNGMHAEFLYVIWKLGKWGIKYLNTGFRQPTLKYVEYYVKLLFLKLYLSKGTYDPSVNILLRSHWDTSIINIKTYKKVSLVGYWLW